MTDRINEKLFDFIAACPTAFHTAAALRERLIECGYTELFETEEWQLAPGKYFTVRNGSALIALNIPRADFRAFMLMAAHGDSPCFKIKEQPETESAGLYVRLNTEKYGGMIHSTWLDRPLTVAGRVILRDGDRLITKLVELDEKLLIPSVAIHMDRTVNDGKKLDPNIDMLPLVSSTGRKTVKALAAEKLGTAEENILSAELFVCSGEKAMQWGSEGEFVSAPRLDDLQCVFACAEGFLNAAPQENAAVLCVFDNEEVGSGTKQGADSDMLYTVLSRVNAALGRSEEQLHTAVAGGFMVSADNAHAVHPNHPEYADRNDRPQLNGGIVIKHNANQRYTTDAVSAAVFTELCGRAGVKTQRFTNRADLPGGSTLGNISQAHLSLNCVDIGLAQLAMHSAYETAGAEDTAALITAAGAFFSSPLALTKEGIVL